MPNEPGSDISSDANNELHIIRQHNPNTMVAS